MSNVPEKAAFRVSVRTLVEMVLRTGDLNTAGSAQRMLEGTKGHQRLQSTGEGENEVTVRTVVENERVALTVYGRIDRLLPGGIIEEIKTTWRDPTTFHEDEYPLHWAQAYVYAYIYAFEHAMDSIRVRLAYLNLDDGSVTRFTREKTLTWLTQWFTELTAPYLKHLTDELAHRQLLAAQLEKAAFPYEGYRTGQREMMAQVFMALREHDFLLAQAPTGTGKTMAVLYPALKALARGHVQKLFYLTARGTGRFTALDAACRLREAAPELRTVELSAKAQLCPYEETRCTSGECPYVVGYYDRVNDAVGELLAGQPPFSSERIRETALRHTLCPFEVSLDLSLECDVIVGDYNYAFDPRTRLQRYFGGGRKDVALLIDEAHNLPSRARDMYSAALYLKPLEELRKSVARGTARKKRAYVRLRKLIAAVQAEFELLEQLPFAAELPPPPALLHAIEQVLAPLQEGEFADRRAALDVQFMLIGFLYFASDWNEETVCLYQGGKTSRNITLFCRDAAPMLKESYKKARAAVLFSATLTPPSFYGALCGLPKDFKRVGLPSPFPPENLLCLHYPLDTRYKNRETTLPYAADAVLCLARGKKAGNHLVFCPSYAYMEQLAALLSERMTPQEAQGLFTQGRQMTMEDRQSYLARFAPAPTGVCIGLAVLGGVFSEGIDLPGELVSTVTVIGVGVPQIGAENDLLRARYEKTYGEGMGYLYAYLYPGLCRVLQAAGRLIRTDRDRGALLLIDERYRSPAYVPLLPEHWQLRRVGSPDRILEMSRRFFSLS